MRDFQEETGNLYNLEATPAEGTTYRFAKEDSKRWPDILQAGTASSRTTPTRRSCRWASPTTPSRRWPPGGAADQVHRRHRAAPLHARAHVLGARLPQAGAAALSRFRLPYITVTPTFSICPKHGYLAGEHEFCPRCDAGYGRRPPGHSGVPRRRPRIGIARHVSRRSRLGRRHRTGGAVPQPRAALGRIAHSDRARTQARATGPSGPFVP
jgi:hypothetical protein